MASVLTAVRDLGRLREIAMVLVKHGFGEVLGRMGLGALAPKAALVETENERRKIAWPERVRMVLEELGPCFMKLGQIASTRGDVLPKVLLTELKRLQDDVPPVEFAAIQGEVETSLARPLDEVFASFDTEPLAAASIGQVHRARLRREFDNARPIDDGEAPAQEREVVVKVQRPGVRATIERDLELLHFLAAILARSVAEARIYDPVGLVDQFDRSITAELDFGREADNAERFRRNFEGDPHIAFPVVYKGASSKRVLTIEFFDGLHIQDALKAEVDGKLLARMAVGLVVKMIFDHGFFHADPHPGNIIILGPNAAPVIGLIDLGMVGRLSPDLRDKTVRLMVAAVREDSLAVADALYAIGRPTKKVDMTAFRAEVSILSEKYIGRALKEIQLSALIRDLVDTAVKYGLEIPTDFMLVGKALMTIEGIGRELDPDLDIMREAKPHFLTILRKRYAPEQLGNEVLRGLERFAGVAQNLPLYAQEVLDDLRLGRLEIRTHDAHTGPTLDRLGRRFFSGLVVASLNITAGLALVSSWSYRIWAAAALLLAAWAAWVAHVGRDAIRAWWSRAPARHAGR